MLEKLRAIFWKTRQWFKRSVWLAKLFNLKATTTDTEAPGLILIQIDGLARKQFQKALDEDKMPFLKSYSRDSDRNVVSFYPGLPSSTPAVQGEIHYGISSAVPAFEYYNRQHKRHFKMYEAQDAQVIEKQLADESEMGGLLSGGASYSNVYQGGAAEAHYCAASIGIDDNIRKATPFWFIWFLLLNPLSTLRTLTLTIIELFIALYDSIKGTIRHGEFIAELKHVPTRIAICIGLREMVELNVRIDVIRGVPIIHANFLGYDEQSHRRGPGAKFAHWTLQGIDSAIRRIWKEASKSPMKNYDLWVFSDHGQTSVTPYEKKYASSISESVLRILGKTAQDANEEIRGVSFRRAAYLSTEIFRKIANMENPFSNDNSIEFPYVVANGPLAHIYLANDKAKNIDNDLPKRFIEELHVPVVLASSPSDGTMMWTQDGQFSLPDEMDKAFENVSIPREWLAEDLASLANQPDAGDFILLSTIPGTDEQITFPMENGSHGAASDDEIEGFAILPQSVANKATLHGKRHIIRPKDLRQYIINYQKGKDEKKSQQRI